MISINIEAKGKKSFRKAIEALSAGLGSPVVAGPQKAEVSSQVAGLMTRVNAMAEILEQTVPVSCPSCAHQGEISIGKEWRFDCPGRCHRGPTDPAKLLLWIVNTSYLAGKNSAGPIGDEVASAVEQLSSIRQAYDALASDADVVASTQQDEPVEPESTDDPWPDEEAQDGKKEPPSPEQLRIAAENACSWARKQRIRCPRCNAGLKAVVGEHNGPELQCPASNTCGWRWPCPPSVKCMSSLQSFVRTGLNRRVGASRVTPQEVAENPEIAAKAAAPTLQIVSAAGVPMLHPDTIAEVEAAQDAASGRKA